MAVLVGGTPGGIMDVRAHGLTDSVSSEYDVTILPHKPNVSNFRDLWRLTLQLFRFRADCTYVLNTGSIGLPALFARILRGTPMLVDTGDLAFRFVSVLGHGSRLRRIWQGVAEALLLRTARIIVVRGSFHKRLLEDRGFRRVVHIPDGVDARHSRAVNVDDDRRRRGWADLLTVGYLGNLSWSSIHDWGSGRELVELLALMRDEPIHGVIIGDGPGRAKLEELANQVGVRERITFLGHIAYDRLPEHLSLIDICLLTQIDDPSWEVRTTGKFPEYLACGRFVLATQIGDAKYVLPADQILPYRGIRDDGYPERLASALRSLLADAPNSLLKAREEGPALVRRVYDYRVLSQEWSEVIRSALHTPANHGGIGPGGGR